MPDFEPQPGNLPDVQPSAPPPAPTSDVSSGSGVAPGGQTDGTALGGHGTPPGDGGQSQFSARDHVRNLGYGQLADGYQDDRALISDLVRQQEAARQALALAQYGQRYLQHAAGFEQYLAQQQQQAQQQPKSRFWNAPEWNPTWRNLVQRDESGNLIAAPGAPPDVLPKYLAFEQYRRDFADRLTTDPESTLSPFVDERARQIASQIVQDNLAAMREEYQASAFIQQHSGWLHAKDANGHVVRDFNGRPVLSEAGKRFRGYVEEAEQLGVRGVQAQEQYASRLLRADIEAARASQGGVSQTNAQIKQNFVQNGNRQPNYGGSVQTSPNPHAPEQNGNLPLSQRLRRDLGSYGITNADWSAPTGA